jgi:DNA mismatch repair protein MSH2
MASSRPELKIDDESSFVRFFRSLPPAGSSVTSESPGFTSSINTTASDPESPSTIRVFDRSDYYTAHGPDARYIAKTVYRSAAVLRQLSSASNPLDSVSMSVTVFKGFLRDALLRESKRVEIWERHPSKSTWFVSKSASPGNLQDVEDILGENVGNSAPMILAVKLVGQGGKEGGKAVGACFCDASIRELGVAEFLDGETFSNFESLVIQLGVREVIVGETNAKEQDVDMKKLRAVAENCGCVVSGRAAGEFSAKDVESDLERLLKGNGVGWSTLVGSVGEQKAALGAAAALIKYLGLMSDSSNFGQFALYQHDLAQYMRLDASAVRALHLMPGPRDGSKTMSLYGLLDHCKTPMGHRLLAQWLKQPLMSVEAIEKRQKLVEAFVEDVGLRQEMQEEHLRSMPDLGRLAKKFQRGKARLEDVIRAYQASTRLAGLAGLLDGVMDERYKDVLDAEYTKKLLVSLEQVEKTVLIL